jgi:hypothetical protein
LQMQSMRPRPRSRHCLRSGCSRSMFFAQAGGSGAPRPCRATPAPPGSAPPVCVNLHCNRIGAIGSVKPGVPATSCGAVRAARGVFACAGGPHGDHRTAPPTAGASASGLPSWPHPCIHPLAWLVGAGRVRLRRGKSTLKCRLTPPAGAPGPPSRLSLSPTPVAEQQTPAGPRSGVRRPWGTCLSSGTR